MDNYTNYVATCISSFAEKSLIVCDAMGYISDPNFEIDRAYFDNNLIMFVLSGTLIVEQYDRQFQIFSEQGILMSLRDKHRYYFNKNSATSIIWLHFRGIPCNIQIKELCRKRFLPFIFEDTQFTDTFRELQKAALEAGIPDEFRISSIIYSMVSGICSQVYQTTLDEPDSFSARISRYMLIHIDEKFDLSDFSNYMAMSRYHFCRKFRQEFSCTPLEYVQRIKIGKAKQLLIFTQMPLSEIACSLGYCDQSHFSRIFTSIVGISPRKFRKENSGKK